jgi:hypothetical protein
LGNFGEEEELADHKPKSSNLTDGDEWRVQDQITMESNGDKCTVTICELGDKLKFDVLNTVTKDVFSIACTQYDFDDVMNSIELPAGPARVNAAIHQILQNATTTLEKNKFDDFGDEGEEADNSESLLLRAKQRMATGDDAWHVRSQEMLELAGEKLSVTIYEFGDNLRFAVYNTGSKETYSIDCTHEDFDGVMNAIQLPPGPARVTATLQQILQDAGKKLEDQKLDDFGGDVEVDAAARQQFVAQDDEMWKVRSQEPWLLDEESCNLTILENIKDGQIRFELLKLATSENFAVGCTTEYFQDLCNEHKDLAGSSQTNAAIQGLFTEALEQHGKDQGHTKIPRLRLCST